MASLEEMRFESNPEAFTRETVVSLTEDGWLLVGVPRDGQMQQRFGMLKPEYAQLDSQTSFIDWRHLDPLLDPEELFVELNQFNPEEDRWTEEDCRLLGRGVVGVVLQERLIEGVMSHAEPAARKTDEEIEKWFEDTIIRNRDKIIRFANERAGRTEAEE